MTPEDMTPEEIIKDFTQIALKELIRNSGDTMICKEFDQKKIGEAAANIAKAAFEQMQFNLSQLYD